MSRPVQPLGTDGSISVRKLGSKYAATTRYRDMDGDYLRIQATATSETKATNALKAKIAEQADTAGDSDLDRLLPYSRPRVAQSVAPSRAAARVSSAVASSRLERSNLRCPGEDFRSRRCAMRHRSTPPHPQKSPFKRLTERKPHAALVAGPTSAHHLRDQRVEGMGNVTGCNGRKNAGRRSFGR